MSWGEAGTVAASPAESSLGCWGGWGAVHHQRWDAGAAQLVCQCSVSRLFSARHHQVQASWEDNKSTRPEPSKSSRSPTSCCRMFLLQVPQLYCQSSVVLLLVRRLWSGMHVKTKGSYPTSPLYCSWLLMIFGERVINCCASQSREGF